MKNASAGMVSKIHTTFLWNMRKGEWVNGAQWVFHPDMSIGYH